ncbi:CPBP family intramembrane metalloprotease [Paenibacillus sp. ACRRX]|uniref:type II CAAX endopeptidase family protein n=1 Tax=Paenibacillus sp. ACRRX TaxID=2918206 RepID=UPI001EF53497|nr:type II CAAX endopeptidase family protein [Paenibacillus sp. ACRRX]MCG7410844.1 CPBP family intramembrane metalloprotease [Paenibacillus sp. ACRRX]
MNKEKKLKKPITSFVVLTNIIFWPLFCLAGAIKMLEFPAWLFDVAFIIAAWSSTFAFAILFKRIYPGESFIQFAKNKFKNKLKLSVLVAAVSIQTFIFVITLFLVAKNSEVGSMFAISSWGVLSYHFFLQLVSGAMGEELGWRGFAQMELQKRHSPLKASIIIGFWWGLWHLPLWFTTGYMGMDLIKYIIFFMIALFATKIVMTAFYNLNHNLVVPIMIHQLFNFFIGLINGNLLDLILYSAILYAVVAVILIVVNPKNVLYGTR